MDFLPDYIFTTVALLIVLIVVTVYRYFTSTFDYWKDRGVPYDPPTFLFGSIKDALFLRKTFSEVHQDVYKRFEGHPFVGIFHLREPALLVRDPDVIKTILVRDFQHFRDRGLLVHPDKNPLQQHLFNLKGHQWTVMRHQLTPAFTARKMRRIFSLAEKCSRQLVDSLQHHADDADIVEVKEILSKYSTDVIGTCAFGLETNALANPHSEFREMGRRMFEPSLRTLFAALTNFCLPEVGRILKMDEVKHCVSKFFLRIVRETMEYRVKYRIQRNDVMQLLINLKNNGRVDDEEGDEDDMDADDVLEVDKEDVNLEFDDEMLAAQAFGFFLAGYETASLGMSFAVNELAVNPEVQTKLREEVDKALEDNDGKFTYDSIMNMPYLDKVISETFRKYPTSLFLLREVTTPYRFHNTKVFLEKGTTIIIPTFALQRDPKHFPDPLRFDPERFSEDQKASRHSYTHLPFGGGPRNCVAMKFGLLQTKLGLAALISKYEFHVCERTEIPIRFDPRTIVTSSATGTFLKITNRR